MSSKKEEYIFNFFLFVGDNPPFNEEFASEIDGVNLFNKWISPPKKVD